MSAFQPNNGDVAESNRRMVKSKGQNCESCATGRGALGATSPRNAGCGDVGEVQPSGSSFMRSVAKPRHRSGPYVDVDLRSTSGGAVRIGIDGVLLPITAVESSLRGLSSDRGCPPDAWRFSGRGRLAICECPSTGEVRPAWECDESEYFAYLLTRRRGGIPPSPTASPPPPPPPPAPPPQPPLNPADVRPRFVLDLEGFRGYQAPYPPPPSPPVGPDVYDVMTEPPYGTDCPARLKITLIGIEREPVLCTRWRFEVHFEGLGCPPPIIFEHRTCTGEPIPNPIPLEAISPRLWRGEKLRFELRIRVDLRRGRIVFELWDLSRDVRMRTFVVEAP